MYKGTGMFALWLLLATNPYQTPLKEGDQANISYIITTLSEHNLLSLWGYEKTLKETGEKTRPIHPLRYLGYIYSTDLQRAVPKISKYAWKRFVNDFSESLESAKKEGALSKESIEGFAKETGRPLEKLEPYFESSDWKGLFNYLNSSIP